MIGAIAEGRGDGQEESGSEDSRRGWSSEPQSAGAC